MMGTSILSDSPDCRVTITHRPDDPGAWIVRRWKKSFWFTIRKSSAWFTSESQALAFARDIIDNFSKTRERT